jgi:hypothetical protein
LIYYGHTAVIVHANLTTGYGGAQVPDWANATRVTVPCDMEPMRRITETVNSAGTLSVIDKRLHCPPDTVITTLDRVEWRGGTYEVNGIEEHTMAGRLDHFEALLTRFLEPPS